ncbi:MAG: response regulator [bacterium]|nr:response regulator [bacterium]
MAEALHASEGRLKAILAALELDKVVAVDRDGTVVSILGESGKTGRYGVTAEDIPGRSIHDFVPGDGGDRILEATERTYQTGMGEELEVDVDLPNGSFAFDVSLRALLTSSGEVESALAIVRDVTQRKTIERALQQAQKLESLGVLAGGIAHDFNNLLVGILGNSDTALQEIPVDSPARRRIEDVRQASERAADLTQQLLAYAGKAEVSFGSVDLAALVSEMMELLRTSVSGKARLEVEHDSETVWVHADATQIRQVVMNFITNASEALQEEAGRVRVRTGIVHADRTFIESCQIRDDLSDGDFALLEVSDDGCGMDSETTARIFDPFFTTKFQGRGLGLASTLGIILSHRGAIRVESQPGDGTTLQVLLPLATAPKPDESVHRSRDVPSSATILVVDDEDMVRVAAARMLNALGYRTIEVSSGSEAVDATKAHDEGIAAVLLDLTMPEMDGEQTLDALRALRSTLPVVFMSGHSDAELADRIRGTRFTTYVRKPFRLEALGHAIESVLAGSNKAE